MTRILLVDDERALLSLCKEVLEQREEDFRVDIVLSAKEALQKLLKKEYDAVISDYRMPVMDGLEFLSELRRQGNEIPFIMFTGKGREDVAVQAFRRGADGYVMKGGDLTSQYAELAHSVRQAVARRKAEKELRWNERRLSTIIENLGAGLVIGDKNDITTYVNPAHAKMLGYSPEEMVGRPGTSFVQKDSLAKRKTELTKRRGGESSSYELDLTSKDGGTVPIQVIGTSLLDERGEYSGYYALTIDMTERNKREERLRSDSLILENISDSIIVTDLEGRVTYWSNGASRIFGYTAKEMLGKSITKLSKPEERRQVAPVQLENIRRGTERPVEWEGVRKDGTPVWLLLLSKLLKDSQGKPIGMIGVGKDITERKRMEEALRESEERYRSLVELAHDGIIVTEGRSRTVTFANHRMAEILGYTVEELMGKSYVDLVHPDDMEQYLQDRKSFFAAQKASTYERHLIKKDGSTIHTLLSVTPLDPGDTSESAPTIGVNTDITERKRLEDREHFLHSLLRHDLGNKLQAAHGYAELLKRAGFQGKQKEYMERLQESLQDTVGLIERVRELRAVEETRETANLSLDSTIQEAMGELRTQAEEQGVTINYKGTPNATVTASPLLKNAFSNLIDNSIKHAGCKKIWITVKELKDNYRVTVEDDGKGIPETFRKELFKRGLKRIGSSGSGLGLHLVKRIIDASDGTIQLKDSKRGTRFDIHLKKARRMRSTFE